MTPRRPQTVFDEDHYVKLIESRGATIKKIVKTLGPMLNLSTALDAGCGLGFFAELLRESGLEVRAFDARAENVQEAQRRYPHIPFQLGDLQEPSILELGTFDLVLCFGLLYHLESTLLSIRNLQQLTRKFLLLESMCFPDEEPWMLLREEPSVPDQSVSDLAFYATEGCLVKMLYRAGFEAVYRVVPLPDHDDFRDNATHVRRRTVLVASHASIRAGGLTLLVEPKESSDPWAVDDGRSLLKRRARAFLARSTKDKLERVHFRLRSLVSGRPPRMRLPFGAVWAPEQSALDERLATGIFEPAELRFVENFLKPGMVVLDVGAHHGLYTLLASKRVGPSGKVFAFEPSPRERKRLTHHITLNKCGNVQIESVALGSKPGDANLFLVQGSADYCNSLKPPLTEAKTIPIRVKVSSVDEFVARAGISRVDFVKLDIEGGELEFLKGAVNLMDKTHRPVMLVEVCDLRTKPWGYSAREIVRFLDQAGYRLFSPTSEGSLEPADLRQDIYDTNLVAFPSEQLQEHHDYLK